MNNNKPFTGVPCAYHLHYHFCFQTKFNRPRFAFSGAEERLTAILESVCKHSKHHLLGHSLEKDRLYCLVSLKADDVVSAVARTLKSNIAREFNAAVHVVGGDPKERGLWSIGYYVGSVGKASKKAAEQYINDQGEHHGIRNEEDRRTMRWVNPGPPSLRAAHATFDLSYHIVLVTAARSALFDDEIAPGLFNAIIESSEAEGFHIERMTLLYDHLHILAKTTPSNNIRTCIEAMMNRSWRFMTDRYWGVLKNTDAYNVWSQSFYVSTVGDATTAQVKSFLSRGTLG